MRDPRELLTPRQLKVTRLLYEGHAPKAIARRLGITINTVGAHMNMAASRLRAVGWHGRPTVVLVRYYAEIWAGRKLA